MEKLLKFLMVVGAIAFVFGQGFSPYGYRPYTYSGQYGYVRGYPLGEYLQAKNVYLRARLLDRKQDNFIGDIVGLGALFLLWAIYTNRTGTYIG